MQLQNTKYFVEDQSLTNNGLYLQLIVPIECVQDSFWSQQAIFKMNMKKQDEKSIFKSLMLKLSSNTDVSHQSFPDSACSDTDVMCHFRVETVRCYKWHCNAKTKNATYFEWFCSKDLSPASRIQSRSKSRQIWPNQKSSLLDHWMGSYWRKWQ